MTQQQVAQRLDSAMVTRSRFASIASFRNAVSEFENDRRPIPHAYRLAISITFDIPIEWFSRTWPSLEAFVEELGQHRGSPSTEPRPKPKDGTAEGYVSDAQDVTAPVFGINQGHVLSIDGLHGNASLARDESAIRRHAVTRLRVGQAAHALAGSNNATRIAPICEKIADALGNCIDETEPHLLVLEAQSLRDAVDIQQNDQNLEARVPLSGTNLQAVRDAVNALNLLIGSDPFLEEIDTKRLGPDVARGLPDPSDLVDLADAIAADKLTDSKADHVLHQAAANAPSPAQPANRKTGFMVRLGLNLVRFSINLILNYENEVVAFVAGGVAVGIVAAGVVATAGTVGGASALAWGLAKNIKANESKWRKFAEASGVTSQNFDLLMERIDKLPLT